MTRAARRLADHLDVWWCCLKPHCYLFFTNPADRDEHMKTCAGCEEIPF